MQVFHSGTKEVNGRVATDGGRVLTVTALGETLAAAQARAYEAVKLIQFTGMAYRTDIAGKALARKTPKPAATKPVPTGKLPPAVRPGTKGPRAGG